MDGVDGRIALVRYASKEIILADTAFMRLWGYYIYHELGHVIDKRLGRELSSQFHALAANESTADAFALWVVLRYTENPKPVFWNTPYTADYEAIAQFLEESLQQIA